MVEKIHYGDVLVLMPMNLFPDLDILDKFPTTQYFSIYVITLR